MRSTAVVFSRASLGLQAPVVSVEVHLSNGLPRFSIVGLPEAAVRESRDRVRSAILNAHFNFPAKRITVNLAPADLPKEGGRFDLPIALGILAAMGHIQVSALGIYEFVGELALTGELRAVKSALAVALACATTSRYLFVPSANAEEAALAGSDRIIASTHLLEVVAHLNGEKELPFYQMNPMPEAPPNYIDLQEVRGQDSAKRALTIAAAGAHSLLMVGPPGTGKTLLASCLPGLLPPLRRDEALEVASLLSLAGKKISAVNWQQRPLRSPHHTASSIALVGGGGHPRPGEISLAHHGILFLDELPEFNRVALETLREPLESGKITISRAARQVEFPAAFQLVAAMNPCPCGYAGDPEGRCHCTLDQIQRYRARISGPLLDRIDMQLEIPRLDPEALFANNRARIASESVRAEVIASRERQYARQGKLNSYLLPQEIEEYCAINSKSQELLITAMKKMRLSMRAAHRILRLARTIADLAGEKNIGQQHLLACFVYRRQFSD